MISRAISAFALLFFALTSLSSVHALDLVINELTFLSANGEEPLQLYEALPNTSAPTLVAPPHWQGKGTVEPAVFAKGSEISLRAKISTDLLPTEKLVLSASSELFSFKPVEVLFSDSTSTVVVLTADGPLPNKVGVFSGALSWSAREIGPSHIHEHLLAPTNYQLLTTFKEPIKDNPIFKEMVLWSCEFAQGLMDEKDICDALISRLNKTGLHYGRRGWSTFDILKNKGGMCGGWCKFFQDFCATQGVRVTSWFFTLEKTYDDLEQIKWSAIDIHDGGLNNDKPTFKTSAYLVDEVYPKPRYYGPNNSDDDVFVDRRRSMYRFFTGYDGHCVNFLSYEGKQYMYDPSFGTGPFGGFFEGDVPEHRPMDNEALTVFRQVYFDRGVTHLQGNICYKMEEDRVLPKRDLDPKTSLVPNEEIKVVWQNLDNFRQGEEQDFKRQNFARIYKKQASPEMTVDYAELFQSFTQKRRMSHSVEDLRTLLLRRDKLTTTEGSQLPGVLPPLQILQALAVKWAEKHAEGSLDKEVKLLKNEATGFFRQLID